MSDALINGLAGAGGGIIAQLITYPLQTVNARQQTERDVKKEKRKLGTVAQMCQVVKHEGWGRLYGGLTPSIVGTAASQGVYYYFYQIFRNNAEVAALEHKKRGIGDGSVGMLSSLVVAALAGCVNVLLTNPIWVVVTRMQTHTKTLKKSKPCRSELTSSEKSSHATVEPPPFATSHAIQEVYDEAGLWGFWRGVFPTLIMARLQAKQVTTGDKRHHYKGTLDAILKMIRYEGFYGFYKGMGTKIVQSVLAAAVLFMIKEELVKGARFLLAQNKPKSKPP
ncbi:peroxisomal nicotinamide adenine dinucleotide carrier [Citrus sinensis]|uniref:Peroxisomal nicotinamide adenine dinucleotide carrier n=1 Tax=Citrus sinensis TaxID=2711 RepID=A0ACB8L146_CITSI|nr:peroxisomal nicotinamide adenine dinucleotide carrier [Citrus sinensis]